MTKGKPRESRRQGAGASRYVFASRLASVIKTLTAVGWNVGGIDDEIQQGIGAALEILNIRGMVVYFASSDLLLTYTTPRCGITKDEGEVIAEEIKWQVRAQRRELLLGHVVVLDLPRGFKAAVTIPRQTDQGVQHGDFQDYFAFLLADSRDLLQRNLDNERRVMECHVLRMLFYETVRRRVQIFDHFPPKISRLYWDHSLRRIEKSSLFGPPWEPDVPGGQVQPVRTATVVLDLRKSTFCMEQADEPDRFAQWLDQFVQILINVSYLHGGVFDKFTGDGVIVHFLARECAEAYHASATTAALACAVDMLLALANHLPTLRKMIHLNCALLGGGVGIDVSDAFWSCDRKGNPIVVGKGVVNACRLSDGAQAGRIRLTNSAYHDLMKDSDLALSTRAALNPDEVLFESKEFADRTKVLVWEFAETPRVLGTRPARIVEICEAVREKEPESQNG